MIYNGQSSRRCFRIFLAPVLALLCSGTAYGFTGIDAPAETVRLAEAGLQDPLAATDAGSETVPSLGAYLSEAIPDIVGGTERIFSQDNVPLTLIGLGLTGLALDVDHRVKNYFQERKPLIHVEKYGDTIGAGYPEGGIAVGLWGIGELAGNRKLADTGVVALEAYVVDGVFTEGLKYAVGRRRPNGYDTMSFPSGHASITATMAASISEMYDWDLRISVPLYLTTAFVSASRLQANEHYLSDVIAGTTLGTVIGTSVAKYHKEKMTKSGLQIVALTPVFDGDLKGYMVTLKF